MQAQDVRVQINTLSKSLLRETVLLIADYVKGVIIGETFLAHTEMQQDVASDHFAIFEIFSIYRNLVNRCFS